MSISDATESKPRIELNGPAPDFTATTTHGPITLSKWAPGKWVILFSHPADFTPVCTTEFMEFARLTDEFEKRNCALIGNSIDSIYSHIAWVRDIESKSNQKVKFPVIADLDQKVAQLYGMLHTPSSVTATVRCVYFIDPNRVIRAMIYYPLNVGRNIDEVLRVLDALQFADANKLACPVNWRPGQMAIVPAPVTTEAADQRVKDASLEVKDWYLSQKKV